jgi:hypothetical protein
MNDCDRIRNTIARLVHLYDRHDHAGWVEECLTEDVKLEAGGYTLNGRQQVLETIAPVAWESAEPGVWVGTHILSEPHIELDGDRAAVLTDVMTVQIGDEPGQYKITSVHRYNDDFVRGPSGDWKISARRTEILGKE